MKNSQPVGSASDSNRCPDELIKKYSNICPDRRVIELAFHACSNPNNESLMFDKILEIADKVPMEIEQDKSGQIAQNIGDDDAAVNKAIMESLQSAKENNYFIETRNPVERKRKNGVPVGLKNVGNSIANINSTKEITGGG